MPFDLAKEQNTYFKALFEAMADGVVVSDMEGNFVLINEAEARINGYENVDAMRRNLVYFADVYELSYPDGRSVPFDDWPLSRVLRGESISDLELRGRRTDTGQEWYFSFSGQPVYDKNGRQNLCIIITRDITEQKRAEDELRKALQEAEESRRLLDALMEYVPQGITIADAPDVTIRRVSKFGVEMLGSTHESMTAEEVAHRWRVYHEDGVTPMDPGDLPLVRAVVEGETVRGMELVQEDTEGRRLSLLCNAGPIFTADGHVTGGIVTWTDITRQKQVEEALRESERRYKELARDLEVERGKLAAAIENMPVGVVIGDAQGRLFSMNNAGLRLHGFMCEDEMFDRLDRYVRDFQLLYPDRRIVPTDEWPASKAMRGEFLTNFEVILKNIEHDSEQVVSYSTAPVLDADGELMLVVYVMQDLTERRRGEEELQKAYNRLERIFSSNVVGMLVADPYGGLYEANDYSLNLLGYTREEFENGLIRWDERTPPEYAPVDRKAIEELRTRGVCTPYEKEYIRKDGSHVWVLLADAMLPEPEEQIVAFVIDISDRKRAEEEIMKLNTELEQRVAQRTTELENTNKELEAFSYSVSHDLRTPLRAIDGFSNTLLKNYRESLDERGQDYLCRVRKAAQRMGQLIDDILDLSRAGRAEMRRQEVDITAMVYEVLKDLQESQPERRVDMFVQQEMTANVDSHLLRIVLVNLLGNAWKFTAKKETPRIEVGSLNQNGEQVYYVRDNGAGFNPAYADKLFAPFQRLHTESEFTGTGIGLALVQRIIRRHGGRIWAESGLGEGSTFFFTLEEANQ